MDRVKPEEVGLSSPRLSRIQPFMQNYVEQKRLPGLVTMVARHGKVAYFECFGMMDNEASKPMQFDTLFRIASMTKPITSVAALMLYEEGCFQLNDPVSDYIPEFKDAKVFVKPNESGMELAEPERDMTIRDLFTHTSGLSDGSDENSPSDALYRESNIVGRHDLTLRELVQKLSKLPLTYHPGQAWRYSFSHDVLAYLVEVISGESFDTFLEQRIFEPLGMLDTGFKVSEEKIGRLAAVYRAAQNDGLERLNGPAYGSQRPPAGGGGLFSTVSDYVKFAQLMLNSGMLDGIRLLSRKTVELMTAIHIPNEMFPPANGSRTQEYFIRGYDYGLGVRVLKNPAQAEILGSVGSFGWAGTYNTYFWVDPQEELIGLILTQFSPFFQYPIDRQFMVLSYQAIVD